MRGAESWVRARRDFVSFDCTFSFGRHISCFGAPVRVAILVHRELPVALRRMRTGPCLTVPGHPHTRTVAVSSDVYGIPYILRHEALSESRGKEDVGVTTQSLEVPLKGFGATPLGPNWW